MRYTEGEFQGRCGLKLYNQAWLPDQSWKAVLVVVHGLADHSGRYMNLVNYFVPKGYAVFSFDQRGHGKSQGRRGFVERFSYYLDDLSTFIDKVHPDHKGIPVFLFGHSLGGTIAATYAADNQTKLAGLILSSPLLKLGSSVSKLDIAMARILSMMLPKIGVAVIDSTAVSRDKHIVEAYNNDPLVYHGKISARLGSEMLNTIEKHIPSLIACIDLPILIMSASADRLAKPEGGSWVYVNISSKDKTLKQYQDLYHEILNEPEKELVLRDIENWLAKQLIAK